MSETFTTMDLFAGAGGLTLGFEQSSVVRYRTIFAVESDAAAARTFKSNFGCDVHAGPIELCDRYPDADVIVGGPPCQGFSPLGRDLDYLSRKASNDLCWHFLNTVRIIQPRAFVIENVPPFLKSFQFRGILRLMSAELSGVDEKLSRYGYAYGVLTASDYGVPQTRKRAIFLAVRDCERVPWPPPVTHGPAARSGQRVVTVRDAIGDLPSLPTDEDMHWGRNPRPESIERYRAIPEGGNRFDLQARRPDLTPPCWLNKPTGTTDVMGRMWWDRPSPTIRTEFFKPEKGRYLHPEQDRPITHREAARLQSFPDDFVFEGSKTEVACQIGNAVPPRLAVAIADHLGGILANHDAPNFCS